MAGENQEKNKGGRPLAYDSEEKLQAAVDQYFTETAIPTLAGLAYSLGISRSTLYEYSDGRFSDIVKKARERVEVGYEERLIYGTSPTGVIFALKNMGWKDKTETGFTDSEGKDVQPPVQTYILLPSNQRDDSSLPAPESHGQ